MPVLKHSRPFVAATFAALLALVFLAGCGRPSGQSGGAASAQTESGPAPRGTPEAPREVRVEVGDHMRYSVTRIEAEAGETIRLLLVNTGSAPKEAMGHNWVLLRPGVNADDYLKAAVRAREHDYLPPDRAADVLAATRLIGGRARDAVVFVVPEDLPPGTMLDYVCTFPGHQQLGMRGVLVLRAAPTVGD